MIFFFFLHIFLPRNKKPSDKKSKKKVDALSMKHVGRKKISPHKIKNRNSGVNQAFGAVVKTRCA